MPTRRIMELSVVTVVLMHPIMGIVRIWAGKTMLTTQSGSFKHGLAEVAAVIA